MIRAPDAPAAWFIAPRQLGQGAYAPWMFIVSSASCWATLTRPVKRKQGYAYEDTGSDDRIRAYELRLSSHGTRVRYAPQAASKARAPSSVA